MISDLELLFIYGSKSGFVKEKVPFNHELLELHEVETHRQKELNQDIRYKQKDGELGVRSW